VAVLAFIPGFGSFAYLASKPFRQEPVIRAVAFDQALRHTPLKGYRRLHLGALTRSMATPAPKTERSLTAQVRNLPVVLGAAVVATAVAAGLAATDASTHTLQLAGGGAVASRAWRRLRRSEPSGGAERPPPAEQAGVFFWLVSGAGLSSWAPTWAWGCTSRGRGP
jgi:hypothetical protein